MCSTCSAAAVSVGRHGHGGHEVGEGTHASRLPCSREWVTIQKDAALKELQLFKWHKTGHECNECQTKHLTKAEAFLSESALMAEDVKEAMQYLVMAREVRAQRKHA